MLTGILRPYVSSVITNVCYRSYVNRPEVIKDYLNPLYEPNGGVLSPSVVPQSLVSPQSSNPLLSYIKITMRLFAGPMLTVLVISLRMWSFVAG